MAQRVGRGIALLFHDRGTRRGEFETSKKVKAVPLQARRDPEGSRKLRFPDFLTTAQDGGILSA